MNTPHFISGVHHIAIICSNYEQSRDFYVRVLDMRVISETFRNERQSWKLNLAFADNVEIELFSFPNPPARVSRPEACGLRHLALRVTDLDAAIARLTAQGVVLEPTRVDEMPIELYEST
jgi:glyoxylase I family protein